ncbi:hypothetical protein PR202_ga08151 [Eleusine coracana subsp. coracana]|uniref:Uncharacterized protein n=1 Tax=Eleusine coracana subsp. coracana TaxID=191504 RepID=A0AAV5C205_ELECO|nr:hypothetical protein PR202_ga08151 [Eleusine coracana subsp. coracana]
MDPNPNPTDAPPHERLAALALRRDLPPDFAGAEIDNDAEAKDDEGRRRRRGIPYGCVQRRQQHMRGRCVERGG